MRIILLGLLLSLFPLNTLAFERVIPRVKYRSVKRCLDEKGKWIKGCPSDHPMARPKRLRKKKEFPTSSNLPVPGTIVSDAPAAEYRRVALIHARKMCRNEQDAEEVANDVFVNFLRKGIVPSSKLTPYQVMKRPVIDAVRAKYGQKYTGRSEFNKRLHYAENFDEVPENNLALSERIADEPPDTELRDELVAKIVAKKLPATTQGILLLQLLYGLQDVEIARLFGWSPTWVMALKRNAFADEPGAKPALFGPSRATQEIQKLQARIEELEIQLRAPGRTASLELTKAHERIRHLEIILEAKGIKFA